MRPACCMLTAIAIAFSSSWSFPKSPIMSMSTLFFDVSSSSICTQSPEPPPSAITTRSCSSWHTRSGSQTPGSPSDIPSTSAPVTGHLYGRKKDAKSFGDGMMAAVTAVSPSYSLNPLKNSHTSSCVPSDAGASSSRNVARNQVASQRSGRVSPTASRSTCVRLLRTHSFWSNGRATAASRFATGWSDPLKASRGSWHAAVEWRVTIVNVTADWLWK